MYNLCFVINKNYIGQFKVTFYSIYLNNKDKNFNVNVIESDLNEDDKLNITRFVESLNSKVSFLDVDNSLFVNSAHMESDSSYTTYYKLFILTHLSHLKKVLYLDCDMVINGDIAPLYNISCDKALVVCKDYEVMNSDKKYISTLIKKGTKYFNAGMILFNMNENTMRDFDIEKIKDYLYNHSKDLHMHDLDIFNHFFNENALFVNSKYNYFTIYKSVFQYIIPLHFKKGIIIHYVGKKPWTSGYCGLYYKKYRYYYNLTSKVTDVSFIEKKSFKDTLKMYFVMLDMRIKRDIKRLLHM
ncbi:MAG: glycosyltransferase family 8 protein [Acholeplasmatales bacterium]|nr:glycosyltransferase family 8 protein [Acholeplasmatales bacterium]